MEANMTRCERCGKQADELFAVCCGAPSCDCGRSEERICDPCWQAAKEQGEVTDGDTADDMVAKLKADETARVEAAETWQQAYHVVESPAPCPHDAEDGCPRKKAFCRRCGALVAAWQCGNMAAARHALSEGCDCEVKAYLAKIGRKGGAAGRGTAKARTTEQARAAAQARWSK